MKIEFSLNRGEFNEFLRLAYRRMSNIGNGGKKFFTINVIVWIFVGMGFTGIFRFYEAYDGLDFKHLNYALIFWGISVVGFIATTTFQRKFYMKYALSDQGHMLKEQKVSFSNEGVRITTDNTEQFFSWAAFQDKECSDNLICLYIDNSQAVLIPKRVIQGSSHEDELNEIIDKNIVLTKP